MVNDPFPLYCGIRCCADPDNAPASIITRARDNCTTSQYDKDVGGVTNVASAADDPNTIENVVTFAFMDKTSGCVTDINSPAP